jgi:hypothetical protein
VILQPASDVGSDKLKVYFCQGGEKECKISREMENMQRLISVTNKIDNLFNVLILKF